jgi:nitroreductase
MTTHSVAKALTKWVAQTHPTRTTEYKKCRRDIELIISSMELDLLDNTTTRTQHVANKFWSRGSTVLKSNLIELKVYDRLLVELGNEYSELIGIVKNTIKTGPVYVPNSWEEICNNRVTHFNWTDQVPTFEIIKSVVDNIYEFSPSKQRIARFFIDVIATYNYPELKSKIYAGCRTDKHNPNARYNPQVLAPWILSFSVRHEGNIENFNDFYYNGEAWLHAGIAIQQGVLAATAAKLGVGFCLCIQNREEIAAELNGRLPIMYLCLGYPSTDPTYYCPIRKKIENVPSRDVNKFPSPNEYIFYK